MTAESPQPSTPDSSWTHDAHLELLTQGLSPVEAGNVVAYTAGLHAVKGGWTIDEIDRLITLRARVTCGLVKP